MHGAGKRRFSELHPESMMKFRGEQLWWLIAALPLVALAFSLILEQVLSLEIKSDEPTTTFNWLQQSQLDFSAISHQQYRNECGSCHFAFQPGLLPQRSWLKLMNELDRHFGDNAALAPEIQQDITEYLIANSADNSTHLRARNLSHSIAATETPVRITDTQYFKRKHHAIAEQQVRSNPAIGSFSNCNNCHRHAEMGLFNEHDILIPDSNPSQSSVQ
ncbi:MAG: hypothetical protein EP315_01025 [Gammaproteobacteria bacterium]|nr:MAG: hypothetical protein EP315_01025 [Gammaproteobacteria bacterium]